MSKDILYLLLGYFFGRSRSRLPFWSILFVLICVVLPLAATYLLVTVFANLAIRTLRFVWGWITVFFPSLRDVSVRTGYLASPYVPAESLLSISPEEFETCVCELLSRMGYQNTEHVGGVGDQGVDIITDLTDELGNRLRFAVQCKKYSPGVNVRGEEVRLFCYDFRNHGADRGIFVTTSGFTPQAIEVAGNNSVRLINGDELGRLLVEYGVLQQEPSSGVSPTGPVQGSWPDALTHMVQRIIPGLEIDPYILRLSLAVAVIVLFVTGLETNSLAAAVIASLLTSSFFYGLLVWLKYGRLQTLGVSSSHAAEPTPPADEAHPTVFCPRCGTQQPQLGRYCAECGAQIRTIGPQDAQRNIV